MHVHEPDRRRAVRVPRGAHGGLPLAVPADNAQTTICDADLSDGLTAIAARLRSTLANECFENTLRDVDPVTPGPQYDCSVIEVRRHPNAADERAANHSELWRRPRPVLAHRGCARGMQLHEDGSAPPARDRPRWGHRGARHSRQGQLRYRRVVRTLPSSDDSFPACQDPVSQSSRRTKSRSRA